MPVHHKTKRQIALQILERQQPARVKDDVVPVMGGSAFCPGVAYIRTHVAAQGLDSVVLRRVDATQEDGFDYLSVFAVDFPLSKASLLADGWEVVPVQNK